MNAWKHIQRAEQIKGPGPYFIVIAPLLNPSSIINTKPLNKPTRKDSWENILNLI